MFVLKDNDNIEKDAQVKQIQLWIWCESIAL